MNEFLYIIKETPNYVWVIAGYLLFIAIKSLGTRIIYLPQLFLVPIILLVIKYRTFFADNTLISLLALTISMIMSFFWHFEDKIKIIRNSLSIQLAANYSTSIILISYFIIQYYFSYLKSTGSSLVIKYYHLELIVNGLFLGYFIGRAICYTYKYLEECNN